MEKEKIKKDIGLRLKIVRSYMKLTQEQMAEMLDISERQYRRYENGDSMINIELANSVANLDVTGTVDISYILSGRLYVDEIIEAGFRKMSEEKLDELLEDIFLPDLLLKTKDNIGIIAEICKEAYKYGNSHFFDKDVRDFLQIRLFTDMFEMNVVNNS